ncbi:Retrovirus-related Pol polyprotein from transposon 17.6 [Trichinella patagoniensis]|uniref:Retrovirus-related Pol polyprotein from transposon 17.6 n=1 Tax=Trichinella patagoniensis TaxID=990121 RepID=A0A0V0ZS73_9BILA|nr:Retrovirus-related Pol polyprotein from transposon 17.6 [Trichinella patagoniensis]
MDNILRVEKLKNTFVYVDNVTICGMNHEEHDENLNRFREVAEKYNLTLNNNKCEFTKTQIKLLGHIIEQGTLKPDPERFKPLQQFPLPRNTASLRIVLGMFAAYSQWIPGFSEKIHALVRCTTFPLPQPAVDAFEALKKDIVNSAVMAIDVELSFTVETDASDHAIDATLIKLAGKAKNDKIMGWRLELSPYNYVIIYCPGGLNTKANALSRICSSIQSNSYGPLRKKQKFAIHDGRNLEDNHLLPSLR